MRVQILDEIIDEIASLLIDEAAKQRCMNAVRAVGRRNGVHSVRVRERLTFVAHLLDLGVSRGDIRCRLTHRENLSDRQALRIIADALKLRQSRAKNVMSKAHNDTQCISEHPIEPNTENGAPHAN